MAIPIVGPTIVVAVVAKVIGMGWLASIATSPFDVATRKRFVEHTEEAIDNPHLKELGYTDEDLAKVRNDLAILKTHVPQGWRNEIFDVAVNVATFKTIARTYGAVSGTVELADYNLTRGANWVDRKTTEILASIFGPSFDLGETPKDRSRRDGPLQPPPESPPPQA